MFRGILNSVPLTVLIIVVVAFTFAVVVLAVWLIRRGVPSTREGFHAEISAPMLGVVAALFGLILAFVIVIAYQNFLGAQDNVSREAELSCFGRQRQCGLPGARGQQRASRRGNVRASGGRR